jgi:Tat protein secretion system quality control protein TatD with DNase activity
MVWKMRTNTYKLSSDLYMHTTAPMHMHMFTHTHTHTQKFSEYDMYVSTQSSACETEDYYTILYNLTHSNLLATDTCIKDI